MVTVKNIKNYGDSGSGKTNYLSKNTCFELTVLMARKVLQSISEYVLKSKYYGLSVDSTPDASHKDQLCVILRYIDQISNESIERFVNFIHIDNHTGENLANATVDFLNVRLNMEISNCRSQSYDNSSNMTGKYNGMKTRILEFNKLAKIYHVQFAMENTLSKEQVASSAVASKEASHGGTVRLGQAHDKSLTIRQC
ncbi:uncharacterized protein LOC136089805 [Hydra vulgaris]|uniref:Uncharacterized protein LOC136089805 n=1 Tax=Hydra vulgaris TaxID=6087 RepID=A0ABM4DC64_HYDVU